MKQILRWILALVWVPILLIEFTTMLGVLALAELNQLVMHVVIFIGEATAAALVIRGLFE